MTWLQNALAFIFILFQLFAALIVADFFSGVLHWLEDRYLQRHWPVIGEVIVAPNDLHHADPRAFTHDGFWLRNWPSFFVAGCLLIWFTFAGWFNPFSIGLLMASSLLPTQVHYWAHRTPEENGPVIVMLQKIGLIQSSQHHWRHHRGSKDNYFCTMTDYVNPVLEYLRVFQRTEVLITNLFGARPKTA